MIKIDYQELSDTLIKIADKENLVLYDKVLLKSAADILNSLSEDQLQVAKFPGLCFLCSMPIYVGDKIFKTKYMGAPTAFHEQCLILLTV